MFPAASFAGAYAIVSKISTGDRRRKGTRRALNLGGPFVSIPILVGVEPADMKNTGILLVRAGSLLVLCLALSQCVPARPRPVSRPPAPPAPSAAAIPTPEILDTFNASLDRA